LTKGQRLRRLFPAALIPLLIQNQPVILSGKAENIDSTPENHFSAVIKSSPNAAMESPSRQNGSGTIVEI
jgi:hypothetical protein